MRDVGGEAWRKTLGLGAAVGRWRVGKREGRLVGLLGGMGTEMQVGVEAWPGVGVMGRREVRGMGDWGRTERVTRVGSWVGFRMEAEEEGGGWLGQATAKVGTAQAKAVIADCLLEEGEEVLSFGVKGEVAAEGQAGVELWRELGLWATAEGRERNAAALEKRGWATGVPEKAWGAGRGRVTPRVVLGEAEKRRWWYAAARVGGMKGGREAASGALEGG